MVLCTATKVNFMTLTLAHFNKIILQKRTNDYYFVWTANLTHLFPKIFLLYALHNSLCGLNSYFLSTCFFYVLKNYDMYIVMVVIYLYIQLNAVISKLKIWDELIGGRLFIRKLHGTIHGFVTKKAATQNNFTDTTSQAHHWW